MRYGLPAGFVLSATIIDGAVWQYGALETRVDDGVHRFGPYDENRDFVTKGRVTVVIEAGPAVAEPPASSFDDAPVSIAPAPSGFASLSERFAKALGDVSNG